MDVIRDSIESRADDVCRGAGRITNCPSLSTILPPMRPSMGEMAAVQPLISGEQRLQRSH